MQILELLQLIITTSLFLFILYKLFDDLNQGHFKGKIICFFCGHK